jgi:hypothetical protein
LDSDSTQMTISVPKGKAVKVIDESKEEKPPFHFIGTGAKRKGAQTEPVDFIQAIIEMSKAEQFVIGIIKDKVGYNDYIGEAYIPTSMFNSGEIQKWKKGFSTLKSKNLVCSTKRSHFMINPNAFIPQEYKLALAQWNKIVHKDNTSETTETVETETDALPYDYPESRAELPEEVEALSYDHPSDE